jgi:hypothetical protein
VGVNYFIHHPIGSINARKTNKQKKTKNKNKNKKQKQKTTIRQV